MSAIIDREFAEKLLLSFDNPDDHGAHLLMNRVESRGQALRLRLVDNNGRDAIGAVVAWSQDGRERVQAARSAFSYCAASDPRVHIGLGELTSVETVTVSWRDGSSETFGPLDAGTTTLQQGQGR